MNVYLKMNGEKLKNYGIGISSTKKEAEQKAAREACEFLKNNNGYNF